MQRQNVHHQPEVLSRAHCTSGASSHHIVSISLPCSDATYETLFAVGLKQRVLAVSCWHNSEELHSLQ